uniref:C2H2-type domain-containing protein n=1 Tax=Salix viminalis TaxID=40686 RepID=A0A6N2MFA5_SALVM
MVMMEDERMEKERAVIFRDTRQYYCDYFPSQATLCGYSREQGRELHEGKLFKCQIENCNREFVYPINLKRRHVRDLHDEKQYVFQEPGCADTNQSCESTRILMLLALASEVGSITVFPNHMAHGEGQEEQDN